MWLDWLLGWPDNESLPVTLSTVMDNIMQEMAESVKQYGVLVPGLVRPKEGGGYEMVAGHRRKMASALAECESSPKSSC